MVVVGVRLTTWLKTAEVLAKNPVPPPYTAVIELVPRPSVVLVTLVVPPTSANLPSDELQFMNVTVPVGVPQAADTVAVIVTACP